MTGPRLEIMTINVPRWNSERVNQFTYYLTDYREALKVRSFINLHNEAYPDKPIRIVKQLGVTGSDHQSIIEELNYEMSRGVVK